MSHRQTSPNEKRLRYDLSLTNRLIFLPDAGQYRVDTVFINRGENEFFFPELNSIGSLQIGIAIVASDGAFIRDVRLAKADTRIPPGDLCRFSAEIPAEFLLQEERRLVCALLTEGQDWYINEGCVYDLHSCDTGKDFSIHRVSGQRPQSGELYTSPVPVFAELLENLENISKSFGIPVAVDFAYKSLFGNCGWGIPCRFGL